MIEILTWLVIFVVSSMVIEKLLIHYLNTKIDTELDQIMARIQLGQLIPITVELEQDQYLCYNAITNEYVCQGIDLDDIAQKFSIRYPKKKIAIVNSNSAAVSSLKKQLDMTYENSNSK
jgi:hypothetical protein